MREKRKVTDIYGGGQIDEGFVETLDLLLKIPVLKTCQSLSHRFEYPRADQLFDRPDQLHQETLMPHFILPHDPEFTAFPLPEEYIPNKWKWVITSDQTANEIQSSLKLFYSNIQNDTVRKFAAGLFEKVKVYGFEEASCAIGLVPIRSSSTVRFLLLNPPLSHNSSIIDQYVNDPYMSLLIFFPGMTDFSSSGEAFFAPCKEKIDVGGELGFTLFHLPTGDTLNYVPSTGTVWKTCDDVVSKHSNSLDECLEWYLSTLR